MFRYEGTHTELIIAFHESLELAIIMDPHEGTQT
jgi:hypothetical protein